MLDHKPVSLADQVYDVLETDILNGKYARGDVLTENKLCEILGVSRTPIREALRRLEQENLIKESGRGSVVLGISESDLEDIFTIRRKIEGIAVSMAAKNATDEEIEKLKSALELQEFYLNKNNAEEIKIMDNRFHETLYLISGSTTFYNILLSLHKRVQKYRKASIQSNSRAKESVEEHRKIFEAIVDRDCQKAETLASQHVENAYKNILRKD
ncbi:MAG: GntR family transcriptional regulator [Ruminococcaceae bacterium]|nr:GntR family transcriptional regulator [Oscillospiraceae bacterium]